MWVNHSNKAIKRTRETHDQICWGAQSTHPSRPSFLLLSLIPTPSSTSAASFLDRFFRFPSPSAITFSSPESTSSCRLFRFKLFPSASESEEEEDSEPAKSESSEESSEASACDIGGCKDAFAEGILNIPDLRSGIDAFNVLRQHWCTE